MFENGVDGLIEIVSGQNPLRRLLLASSRCSKRAGIVCSETISKSVRYQLRESEGYYKGFRWWMLRWIGRVTTKGLDRPETAKE